MHVTVIETGTYEGAVQVDKPVCHEILRFFIGACKEKMIALASYADTEEYAEWAEAHESLEESLLHLRSLLEANIDNIL